MKQAKGVILFLATTIMLGLNLQQAKSQEITVYGYAAAYNTYEKIGYISELMPGIINSKVYFDAAQNQLENQFMTKIEQISGKTYGFVKQTKGFCYDRINAPIFSDEKDKFIAKCTREVMTKKRAAQIERYKKSNFKVRLVSAKEFQFKQPKR